MDIETLRTILINEPSERKEDTVMAMADLRAEQGRDMAALLPHLKDCALLIEYGLEGKAGADPELGFINMIHAFEASEPEKLSAVLLAFAAWQELNAETLDMSDLRYVTAQSIRAEVRLAALPKDDPNRQILEAEIAELRQAQINTFGPEIAALLKDKDEPERIGFKHGIIYYVNFSHCAEVAALSTLPPGLAILGNASFSDSGLRSFGSISCGGFADFSHHPQFEDLALQSFTSVSATNFVNLNNRAGLKSFARVFSCDSQIDFSGDRNLINFGGVYSGEDAVFNGCTGLSPELLERMTVKGRLFLSGTDLPKEEVIRIVREADPERLSHQAKTSALATLNERSK